MEANFRTKGYDVDFLENGDGAVDYILEHTPDCVILDVMMPGDNGYTVCENIRKVSDVPIVFLTAKVAEEDMVKGLLIGADDYMAKPLRFPELEARVQATVRRTQTAARGDLFFPPLEIDVEGHRAFCDGENLQLTTREYDILHFFATSGNAVVTYEDIGKRVWGVYREQDRRSVMVIVSRLRKKLEINPVAARMIETVWSEGYKFTGKKAGIMNEKSKKI
jgi:DNA-binding response OmpR family regulator